MNLMSIDTSQIKLFTIFLIFSTIRNTRRRLGWVLSGPKYCQLICIPNQIARLEFARRCVEEKETFDNVIFTDESMIMLDKHGKLCFRKKGRLHSRHLLK